MDMTPGKPEITLQAETLMLKALALLDQACMGLTAVHLQSALDSLQCERMNAPAPELSEILAV